MPYQYRALDQPFVVETGGLKKGLGASAGGLRVELVGARGRHARLRLWVDGESRQIGAELAEGGHQVVFEDYEVTLHRIVKGSWFAAAVELSVRERERPDEAFAMINTPSQESNRCSPKEQGADLSGIRINAPRRVAIGKSEDRGRSGESQGFAKVVIAGAWSFRGGEMNRLRLPLRHTNHGFTVHVQKKDGPPQKPCSMAAFDYIPNEIPPPDHAEAAPLADDLRVGGWFNINVGVLVAPTRDSRGIYDVWIAAGEFRSNMVAVRVE